ncbi:GntR family transcriptional regulator [Pseudomonas aeruginosa]
MWRSGERLGTLPLFFAPGAWQRLCDETSGKGVGIWNLVRSGSAVYADDIVAQLEAMILEGTLKSGERLPAERVLAEQFGVSRPSLREAIQKLVAKVKLVSRQGGGNYVTESLGATFSDPLLHLKEGDPGPSATCWSFATRWKGLVPTTRRCVRPPSITSA